MTNRKITGIIERHKKCVDLVPYVTAQGGVVIFNGPFSQKRASEVVDFIKHSKEDMTILITEINRLETLIAFIDKIAPRSDKSCNEPGITLSVATERELRDRNHPLFVAEE